MRISRQPRAQWDSWLGPGARILVYLAFIVAYVIWTQSTKTRILEPTEDEQQTAEPKGKRSTRGAPRPAGDSEQKSTAEPGQEPTHAGPSPSPAPPPGPAQDTGAEPPPVLAQEPDGGYPTMTLYAWSARKLPDNSQEVQVLLRFWNPPPDLTWTDLKLRGPKGSDEDLATAVPQVGLATIRMGAYRLRFHMPASRPEFRWGRLFARNEFLCELSPEQWMPFEEPKGEPAAAPQKKHTGRAP